MQLDKQQIAIILEYYLTIFPAEKEHLAPLFAFLEKTTGNLYDRKNMDGHIVGSGIILDPTKEQSLMIYHNIFQRYQQPGGHIDPGETPLQGSQRECEEETGIQQFEYVAIDPKHPLIPIDIGCHIVAANDEKNEGEHWHFNFVYAFETQEKNPTIDITEVSDAKWVALEEVGKLLPNIPRKTRKYFSSYL